MKYIYQNGKIFSKLQLHFKGFEIKRILILHLAEMLQFYDQNMAEFYQIDKQALKDFGITDENRFKELLQTLKKGFEESIV